ncbi:MAG TPA: RidA family protein [Candidatus Poseidoniaceae archaeon]|nr:RidA family protein [Candidatus Poseidoniaceae archaeon]
MWDPVEGEDAVNTDTAPKPVGAYPHARRVGDMLYLSGVGPRQPGTNAIPGGPIHDAEGRPLNYDIKAQTQAVVNNVERVLKEAGGSLENVVDVTSFLVDMDRDFAGYNEVWAETLGKVGPTRTTLAIRSLPTPIAVEMKVVAHLPK